MNQGKYVRALCRDYVVLDLETTGLSRANDEIIEIAMVRVRNGQITDRFQTLVRPASGFIPPFITSLTGIQTSMVQKAPRIHEVIESVVDFLGNDVVVGHNTAFDLGFLGEQTDLSNNYVDTVRFCKKLYPELGSHSLSEMTRYLSLSSNEHRAMADVLATYELYETIQQHMQNRGLALEDLFVSQKKKSSGTRSRKTSERKTV